MFYYMYRVKTLHTILREFTANLKEKELWLCIFKASTQLSKRQALLVGFRLSLLFFLTVEWLEGNKVLLLYRIGRSLARSVSISYVQPWNHTVTYRCVSSLSGGALLTSRQPVPQCKALNLMAGNMTCAHVYCSLLAGVPPLLWHPVAFWQYWKDNKWGRWQVAHSILFGKKRINKGVFVNQCCTCDRTLGGVTVKR